MTRLWTLALAAALFVSGGRALADVTTPFGSLESASVEQARTKAEAWLKDAGKTDAASLAKFQAIWKNEDRTVLDRVVDTFALGNPAVARLLEETRTATTDAPTQVPDILKDDKGSEFFRSNLALAYARSLNGRRVHEDALEALKLFRPEQVVDPASFLFHRAIAEHAMVLKKEATTTITRLLDDVSGAAERYKTVSALMLLDMQTWKDKDLGAVARKMENVERRLDLARGGPQTQKLQKEIIARLDELIKELENKQKQKGGGGGGGGGGEGPPNDGSCPDGGSPGSGSGPPKGINPPKSPATDSGIAGGKSTGEAADFRPKKSDGGFGKAMEREQEQRLQRITPTFSPRHQQAIESYYRKLAEASSKK